ncbi:MAG TPA: orotate phosphoribosyltransferase [Candidatus Eisenbacteria bacterium]|nr:orotate phosphoribosyltransferase [Candidatus Eisenbacteria bacterium]
MNATTSAAGAAALGAPTDADRRRLFDILLERSLRFGDFTLSSGAKSRYYIDVRQTSLHPEGSLLIAKFLVPMLRESGVEAVGGLTLGADPIAGAVALWSQLQGTPIYGFIVRKEAKGHGAGRRIEGPFREGMKVAIVDDVITKGGSALTAFEAAREAGADVRLVACVVDRGEGGPEEFGSRGVPFRSVFHISEFLEGRV